MNQKLATYLIWMLGLFVGCTLLVAVVITFIGPQSATAASTSYADRWKLLPTIAISCGVLIAILTFAREKNKSAAEKAREKSKVFVERASMAFDTAIDLLRDQNNSRVIWVRAARTLRRAVDLGQHISDPDYKHAYDLETERARSELYDALTTEDLETGERTPLPPQFFYGVNNWKTCKKTLDETALESASPINAYSASIDELPPQSGLRSLAVGSVIAIYEFLEYPESYEDPLQGIGEWDDNWQKSHGPDQGARRYVAHSRHKAAGGGKLHDLKSHEDEES